MSPDRVDKAIDEAVRGMMDVEPQAGLRGRVMRRIDAPPPVFTWQRFAMVAGVATCAVLLTFVYGRVEPVTPASQSASASAPDAPVVPPAAVPVAPPASKATGARVASARHVLRSSRPETGASSGRIVSAASVAESARGVFVAALAPLPPIEVEALGSDAVLISDIDITTLRIDALSIDPLVSMPR